MQKVDSSNDLCPFCLEQHAIDIVERNVQTSFKNEEVSFIARYAYCPTTEELYETEDLIKLNDLAMKDAYRQKNSLMNSAQIIELRDKYGISQKDFSLILDWGAATITRYENHQVQDRAHDYVLRKLSDDPKWFFEMINQAKDKLSSRSFKAYSNRAQKLFFESQNNYLIDAVKAEYAGINQVEMTGYTVLNLTKVVELINYFAYKLKHLHKVKLMKLLWYSDALHFKRTGKAITGLAYQAYPMGAVPIAHEQIISMQNVCYERVDYGEYEGFKFSPCPDFVFAELKPQELETINAVIDQLGDMNKTEIVKRMHSETAFKCTHAHELISFAFAKELSIN